MPAGGLVGGRRAARDFTKNAGLYTLELREAVTTEQMKFVGLIGVGSDGKLIVVED